MECSYHKSATTECWPLPDGDAIFTVELIAADGSGQKVMEVGDHVPVCLSHMTRLSGDFIQFMRSAVQLDIDMRSWNVEFLEALLRSAMEDEMGIEEDLDQLLGE